MILIDQIKGFNASKLFIEYYLIIPAEWKFDCNPSVSISIYICIYIN